MNAWLIIRLLFGLLFLYLALHVVVAFYSLLAWKLTLMATEYGHRLALLALALAVVGSWRAGWIAHAGTALLLTSAALLIIPLIKARSIAETLISDLHAGLHDGRVNDKAASEFFHRLWMPQLPALVKPEAFEYARDESGARSLYFHRAAGGVKAPCIVVLHTGSWEDGRPKEFPEWSAYWAANGFAVACIEYRLAPVHRWPAQRDDVRLALEYLKGRAGEMGLDSSSFIMLGRSAGGQIALASAYSLKDPAIRGCIALYSPADLIFARLHTSERDVLNSVRLMQNYIGGDPEDYGDNYRDASANYLANEHSCPTLLIHGRRDTLVWYRQSERLAVRLTELKVPHFHLELPWATHSLDWPFDGPGGQLTRVAVDTFLGSVTGLKR